MAAGLRGRRLCGPLGARGVQLRLSSCGTALHTASLTSVLHHGSDSDSRLALLPYHAASLVDATSVPLTSAITQWTYSTWLLSGVVDVSHYMPSAGCQLRLNGPHAYELNSGYMSAGMQGGQDVHKGCGAQLAAEGRVRVFMRTPSVCVSGANSSMTVSSRRVDGMCTRAAWQAVTVERASHQALNLVDAACRAVFRHVTACREGVMCIRAEWQASAAERVGQQG